MTHFSNRRIPPRRPKPLSHSPSCQNLGGRGAICLAHEEEAGRSCRLPRETGQEVGGSSKTATGSPAPTWPRPAVSWEAGLVLRHVTRALAPPVYSHSLSPVPKLERAT